MTSLENTFNAFKSNPSASNFAALQQEMEQFQKETNTAVFEAGQKYEARYPTDHELRPVWTVIKRTPKTVTIQNRSEIVTKKIHTNGDDKEFCFPDGQYSMCAVLRANRKVK
jgi:hypothetical protein